MRLLIALLVMCLAVVPHVTLAASLVRMQMSAAAGHHAAAPNIPATTEAAPCHQSQLPAKGHPVRAPVCCIIGCGLIAEAPAVSLPSRVILWSPPPLALAEPLFGISTEPAKPPPRPALRPV